MSKKRFLSIVLSAVMILSLACSALAVGQSGRYIGNSTVNGSIYQTYYQVDAQTRTGIKSISVSGTLYEKGTFATVYKGNIIKNLIMDCQSYTKYRPNETTGGIFVSWRRKEELPTGA